MKDAGVSITAPIIDLHRSVLAGLLVFTLLCATGAKFARAEVLQGTIGVSQQWGSGWVNLAKVTTFKKGDRLRLTLRNRNADEILVRFLPLGGNPDTKAGLIPHPIQVPPNLVVEVALETEHADIVQISVHGGQLAWDIRLRDGNGGAELVAAEKFTP
jgi:hypothetical protein